MSPLPMGAAGPHRRRPETAPRMFVRLARAIFGTSNDRLLKGYRARVPAINALEPAMAALSDEALRGKTAEFRARLAKGETLDDLPSCRRRGSATARRSARWRRWRR